MANGTSDSATETKMTTAQLGRRVEGLENDVTDMRKELGDVKTEQAKTTASVDGMRGDMSVLFAKMDQVITGTTSAQSLRDHIPTKYVTWGVGLAISALLTMAGLGVTVTGVAGGVVLWAMNSGDGKLDQKVEYVVKLEDSRHELVEEKIARVQDDVAENRAMHADVEARLRSREANAFTSEDGDEVDRRLDSLDVKVTESLALGTKAWDEITDHEDELDHPIRQTFEGAGREERIGKLEQSVEAIRDALMGGEHPHPHIE